MTSDSIPPTRGTVHGNGVENVYHDRGREIRAHGNGSTWPPKAPPTGAGDVAGLVRRAAIAWCGQKDRETFPEDLTYFEQNWRALPGMTVFVATHAAALIASQARENERLREALVQHNDRLRSAQSIAARDGADTNWVSFRGQVTYTLAEYHELTNEARAALAATGGGADV